ncbi:MAG: hypothetical protein F4039_08740 [Gammaproteobacteria bacterium]|nr:hypothetical protein [Gammaproteobacteria bacterium]
MSFIENVIARALNCGRLALIGITVSFLVVPHSTEVNAELDIPIDPILIPPITPAIIEIDEGSWIEYGKCKVDYTQNIFGAIIWDIILLFWPTTDLVMEHHDVYISRYSNPEADYEENEHQARGFYAKASDWVNWAPKLAAWLLGEIKYVEGEMLDKTRDSSICSPSGSGWERGEPYNTGMVLFRYEQPWEKFHLARRNCQHWAQWVITGHDNLSRDS